MSTLIWPALTKASPVASASTAANNRLRQMLTSHTRVYTVARLRLSAAHTKRHGSEPCQAVSRRLIGFLQQFWHRLQQVVSSAFLLETYDGAILCHCYRLWKALGRKLDCAFVVECPAICKVHCPLTFVSQGPTDNICFVVNLL
jgi:hypothetical protein